MTLALFGLGILNAYGAWRGGDFVILTASLGFIAAYVICRLED